MKSKIEKLNGIKFKRYFKINALKENKIVEYDTVIEMAEKINEIIDYLNPQDKEEERTQSAPMPDISSFPRRNGEYRYPEDYVGDPIGETTTSINQESGGACGGEVKDTLEELFTTEELRYLGEVLQREMFLKNNFKRNKKK